MTDRMEEIYTEYKSQHDCDLYKHRYIFKWNFDRTRGVDNWDKFNTHYKSLDTKYYYELIPANVPVKEHYDLDLDYPTGTTQRFTVEEVVDKLLDTRRFMGRTSSKKDLTILSSMRPNKFSIHVIFNTNWCYKNNSAQKEFATKLKEQGRFNGVDYPKLDLSIYNSNSLFRCLGSVKKGKEEYPLVVYEPQIYSYTDLHSSLVRVYDDNKNFFEPYREIEVIHDDDDEEEVKFTDTQKQDWIKNITLFKSCSEDYDDWKRVVFSLYNIFNLHDPQFCKQLIHTFSQFSKKYNYGEVERFIENIKPTEKQYKFKNLLELCKEKKITRGTSWLKSIMPQPKTIEVEFIEPPIINFPTIRDKYFWTDFIKDVQNLNDQILEEPIYRTQFLQLTYKVLARMNENWIVRRNSNELYAQVKKSHLPLFYCEFKEPKEENEWKIKSIVGESYMKRENVLKYLKFYSGRCYNPKPQNPDMLNTWSGFQAQELVDVDMKQLEEDIQPLLYHIKEVICNGDQLLYDYFMGCWFKTWFNNPAMKLGVVPVIIGEQGAGKSTLPLFLLNYVVGRHQSSKETAISKLTSDYNGILLDKIFIFLDEIENVFELKNKDFEAMKSLITDENITINIKFQEKFSTTNLLNFMITTNNEYCLRLSKHDRRYFILNPSDKHKNDRKYFDNLYNNYFNQEVGDKFFTYCKLYQPITQGLYLKQIPMTQLKEEMVEMTETSYTRYLTDIKKALKSLEEVIEDEDEGLPITTKLRNREVEENIIEIVELFLQKRNNGYRTIKTRELHDHYRSYCELHGERRPIPLPKFTREANKQLEDILRYDKNNRNFKLRQE